LRVKIPINKIPREIKLDARENFQHLDMNNGVHRSSKSNLNVNIDNTNNRCTVFDDPHEEDLNNEDIQLNKLYHGRKIEYFLSKREVKCMTMNISGIYEHACKSVIF